MIKILITGANSYIGMNFENYINTYFPGNYRIDTVDMIDGSWREKDFSGYDSIFHVAGIAHADTGNVSDEIKEKYYNVNTHLTVETAKKAKADGVKQFVFMSSIIVFGTKNECITKKTVPVPDNFYGDSKLRADIEIHKLADEAFKVASIRPPMIYGKNSKGNYPKLAKIAAKIPFFPDFENKRSMLYVENLCEFVRLIIENCENGYFYPQNKEYVKTADMVCEIARVRGKKVKKTKIFNLFITIIKSNGIVRKVFGNLYYEKSISDYKQDYRIVNFEESINRTEKQ